MMDNMCFMVSSDNKTFYNAQNHCENQGGALAQIPNQKTPDLLSFHLSTLETQNEALQSEVDKPNYWIVLPIVSRCMRLLGTTGMTSNAERIIDTTSASLDVSESCEQIRMKFCGQVCLEQWNILATKGGTFSSSIAIPLQVINVIILTAIYYYLDYFCGSLKA